MQLRDRLVRGRRIRRAAVVYAVGIVAAATFSGGLVGSTASLFTAETQNPNATFAGGWIDPPSGLTATPSGYNIGLGWTAGTHGPVTGQQLYGVDNANSSTCTGAVYSAIGSALTATAATYTDTSRGTTSNNGDWFCYQLKSLSATSWTASALVSVQLGLAATSIVWANVTTNNTLTNNDTLKITFNQKTTLGATGTTKVCVFKGTGTSGVIYIGDTAGGATCNTSDSYTIGKITGVALGTNRTFGSSSYTTTSVAPFTMTLTFKGGNTSTFSGTSTFTGSNSTVSSLTPTAVLCARAVAACQPTTTTHP